MTNKASWITLVDHRGKPLAGRELRYATQEVFRITSLGANGEMNGERWDEAQQRYRPTKPIPLHDGVQKITVEYADDEA